MVNLKTIRFFHVLGVRVHLINMTEVLGLIEQWVESHDKGRYIVATQMHGIMVLGLLTIEAGEMYRDGISQNF